VTGCLELFCFFIRSGIYIPRNTQKTEEDVRLRVFVLLFVAASISLFGGDAEKVSRCGLLIELPKGVEGGDARCRRQNAFENRQRQSERLRHDHISADENECSRPEREIQSDFKNNSAAASR